jgi:hypothetical protein
MNRLTKMANDMVQIFSWSYAMQNLDEWDIHLSLAEVTYNVMAHKVRCVAPFEANLGYVSRLPIDFLLGPGHRDMADADNALNFAQKIEIILREVREHLQERQDDMAVSPNECR